MTRQNIAMEPRRFAEYEGAVRDAGGVLVPLDSSVEALIWTDYSRPAALRETLDSNPQLKWVQLPYAGVDAFVDILDRDVVFTCAKASFSEPVAEHALALTLALARKIPTRVKASTWGEKFAFSLFDAKVVVVGGGGIAQQLISLLQPFRADITVISKHGRPLPGVRHVGQLKELDEAIAEADVVVVACSLTPETDSLFDYARIAKLRQSAYLVNIARGRHVVLDDLIRALDEGLLAGAALDVTHPEPLPDDHHAFGRDDLIITPHTADTNAQVLRLFSNRLRANVAAYLAYEPLEGLVSAELGY